jgi:hypothetical protein
VDARNVTALLRRSELTGTIYAITSWRRARHGGPADSIVATRKHDVTQDFYRLAAEMWPELVETGRLTPQSRD